MTRSRRTFTAQEKAAIVLRHLVDKTPVSDLSDEFGLQPTQIYAWQKEKHRDRALYWNAFGLFILSPTWYLGCRFSIGAGRMTTWAIDCRCQSVIGAACCQSATHLSRA